jgi:SAM-dependent methyltransferase
MKKLPLWRRPFGAKRILEVGGGHDPYAGVTHAVDKFPGDNAQRGGDFKLPGGADFFHGDLESLPFGPMESFDYVYASHVFEHVGDPEKAVREINRVAKRGYIETPSPLREQLACPIPYDPQDFHTLFVWSTPGTLHCLRKSQEVIGQFPDTPAGRIARALFRIHREEGMDLEPLLPRAAKTTMLHFDRGLKLLRHESFHAAAREGFCAYEESIGALLRNLRYPLVLRSKRLRRLRSALVRRRVI